MQVVMRLLMDQGDAMLCEEYTYPHIAESMVQPQGYAAIPLAMNAHGIIPGTFRTHLQSLRDAGQPLPKLLYTIPVGQNPTGEQAENLWNPCALCSLPKSLSGPLLGSLGLTWRLFQQANTPEAKASGRIGSRCRACQWHSVLQPEEQQLFEERSAHCCTAALAANTPYTGISRSESLGTGKAPVFEA